MGVRGGRLQDKVALISGGASGIGRASCQRFIEEGAQVLVTDINLAGAEAVAEALGPNAQARYLDVTSEADWAAAIDYAIAWAGKLDIVANIAGIGRIGSIEEVELADWDALIAVNLTGSMLGCKYGVKGITRSGGNGAIINMSSIGGLVGAGDIVGYNASKGGVTLLTKSVAMHCAARGYPIRCVSVHPTYVDTPLLDPATPFKEGERALMIAQLARHVPVGRIATAEEIANVVAFAASDEASMISGAELVVDGATLAGPGTAFS